jgi:hypothetical protein
MDKAAAEEAAEKAAAEKVAAEKAAAEKAAAEKAAADKAAAEKAAAEKVAAEKAAAEAAEKAAADKAAADKAAAEKAAAEATKKEALEKAKKAATEKAKKAAAEKAQKAAAEKAAAEKAAAEKAAAEKVAAEKAAAEKMTAQKAAAEKAAAESITAEESSETPSRRVWRCDDSDVEHSGRDSLSSIDSDMSEMSDSSRGSKRDRHSETPGTANKRKSKRPRSSMAPFKLTVPNSPKFATNSRRRAPDVKSTEEMELDAIRHKQAKLRKQRERRKKSGRKAITKAAPGAQKSTKPLTEPKEFKFRSDVRAKSVERSRECSEDEGQNLFGEFTSMAECVASFEAKTPKRFRSKSRSRPTTPCEKVEGKLTQPQSPSFASDKRIRSKSVFKSQEEMEKEMMDAFAKKPFKAQPINKAVMESTGGTCGVTAVPKKELTQALSPKLRSDLRAESRKHNTPAPESPRQFKANKLNPSVLAGPKLVSRPEVKKCTIPKSPDLLSAQRASYRPSPSPARDESFTFKAKPVPAALHKAPKVAEVAQKPLTEVQPFKLAGDARSEQAKAEFARKVAEQEAKAKEARNFKANPIQHHSVTPRSLSTPRSKSGITEPIPFNLESERRHEAHQMEWERQLEEELERERAQFSAFRAAPAEVLVKSPFVARKSQKPLTEISNFSFHTETRSQQREEFDSHVAAERRQEEQKKASEKALKAEIEANELKQIRCTQLCFKATPIVQGKPLRVQPATKELTTPMSPCLETKVCSLIDYISGLIPAFFSGPWSTSRVNVTT